MLNHYRSHLVSLPFLLVAAVSLVVFFTPASGVPVMPAGTDKLVHFMLFAALAVTGLAARFRRRPLLIGLICYAAVSEALQGVLPLGRSADLADLAIDLAGIAAGWTLARLIRRRANAS